MGSMSSNKHKNKHKKQTRRIRLDMKLLCGALSLDLASGLHETKHSGVSAEIGANRSLTGFSHYARLTTHVLSDPILIKVRSLCKHDKNTWAFGHAPV
jgi:hypothetical protein